MGQARQRQRAEQRISTDPLVSAAIEVVEATNSEDLFRRLQALRYLLDEREFRAWSSARSEGMTWAAFGRVFGTTRSAAQQRYASMCRRWELPFE